MYKYTNHRIPPKSPHITHNVLTNTKIGGTSNKLKFEHPQKSGFITFFQNLTGNLDFTGQLIICEAKNA